ncbi:GntR family transcriptional regulator [Rhabdobacter roseus]|uniref:DNA-binding transcriptional regulator YhcF (GntR family) n=1 Tax=Rhabdobacter roseus TaxID=1655419 RepID=A0A840TQ08_9BACT|nr:GntR family transcriptional regulator [Rhabdobacter roseus]MBB5283807.1 DNA-binding transcriptional regulator YhcF (GntR family) [Rhabdobacter roseus]
MYTTTRFPISYLQIDEKAKTPKFLQIVNSVVAGIERGLLKPGDRLPSINETSEEYLLARATVEKAYGILQKQGHVTACYRKGFFVMGKKAYRRILLLVSHVSESNRMLYNELAGRLDRRDKLDLFQYHYHAETFCEILENQLGNYNYYVVMPHHLGENAEVQKLLKKIPAGKLVLLDAHASVIAGGGSSINCLDGDELLVTLLQQEHLFKKYDGLSLVTSDHEYVDATWYQVLNHFCRIRGIRYQVLDGFEQEEIQKRKAYLVFDDTDLPVIIKQVHGKQWELGRQVGVLSFQEQGYKELLAGGISVIGTNRARLGEAFEKILTTKKRQSIKVPLQFLQRTSL